AVEAVIADTNWHHAAVVLDGDNGQMRFYVDGELKTTVDYTGGINTTTGNTLFIGMEGTADAPGNLYKGFIDRIRIYDTVRTPDQFDIVKPVSVDSWMMF
ncbi:MAG TPA: LamG domain-containing protein, partial [bacterium]|nr:LamG domain-containing protein [bacterium]